MRFHHKLIAAAVMMACAIPAQAQIYKVTLSGANENPVVVTNGTGSGIVTFNAATHQMRVKTTFSGLTGNTTNAHIHCCTTTPTGNAGVATAMPTFPGFPAGVTSGSYDQTLDLTQASSFNPAFISANGGTPATAEIALTNNAFGGRTYLNIHSSTSLGGEIRGNLQLFTFFSGATAQTAPIAIALDSLGANTGEVNNRLVALAALNGTAQTSAVAQLAPLPVSMVAMLATDGLFSAYDQIGNRLGGLRDEVATGDGDIWVRYADGDAEQDLAGRGAAVDSNSDDLTMGIDYRLNDALLVGLALGIQRDEFSYSGALAGSAGELQNNRATLYGELALGGAFLEGMLNFSHNELLGTRNVGMNGVATSEADNEQWGARVALGWDMALGSNFSLTPQARFDWSYLELESYREAGAGPMSLLVDANEIERSRGSLGAQLDWQLNPTTVPYARVFWGHEFGDDDYTTMANFAGGGAAFATREDGLDRDGYTAGFGLNIHNTGGMEGSFGYEYSENDTYESDMLHARLRMRF